MKKITITLYEKVNTENFKEHLGFIKNEFKKYGLGNKFNDLYLKLLTKLSSNGFVEEEKFQLRFDELFAPLVNFKYEDSFNMIGEVYNQNLEKVESYKLDTIVEMMDFSLADKRHKVVRDQYGTMVFETSKVPGFGNEIEDVSNEYSKFFEERIDFQIREFKENKNYIPNISFIAKRA